MAERTMTVVVLLLIAAAQCCWTPVKAARSEYCQNLTYSYEPGLFCAETGDCAGLYCSIEIYGVEWISSFTVQRCVLPPLVHFSFVPTSDNVVFPTPVVQDFPVGYFNLGDYSTGFYTIHLQWNEEDNVVFFRASISTEGPSNPVAIVPEVYIPFNTSECLCSSIDELTEEIASIQSLTKPQQLSYSCTTNSQCDGLNCQLEVPDNPVYFNITILPCSYPLAVDVYVALTDSTGSPAAKWVFDQTESMVLELSKDLKITVDVVIAINNEKSFGVECYVTVPEYEPLQLIPNHTFPLIETACPPNLPSTPSQFCLDLYETALNVKEPMTCEIVTLQDRDCEELWCFLSIGPSFSIDMYIGFSLCPSHPEISYHTINNGWNDEYGTIAVSSGQNIYSLKLNTDGEFYLVFNVNGTSEGVILEVSLESSTSNAVLIPPSLISYQCDGLSKAAVIAIAVTVPVVSVTIIILVVVVVIVTILYCKKNRRGGAVGFSKITQKE